MPSSKNNIQKMGKRSLKLHCVQPDGLLELKRMIIFTRPLSTQCLRWKSWLTICTTMSARSSQSVSRSVGPSVGESSVKLKKSKKTLYNFNNQNAVILKRYKFQAQY